MKRTSIHLHSTSLSSRFACLSVFAVALVVGNVSAAAATLTDSCGTITELQVTQGSNDYSFCPAFDIAGATLTAVTLVANVTVKGDSAIPDYVVLEFTPFVSPFDLTVQFSQMAVSVGGWGGGSQSVSGSVDTAFSNANFSVPFNVEQFIDSSYIEGTVNSVVSTYQVTYAYDLPAAAAPEPATAGALGIGLAALGFIKRRRLLRLSSLTNMCSFVFPLALAVLLCADRATAATIDYSLVSGPDTITFAIPQTPTPNPATPNAFDVTPLSVTINGTTFNNGLVEFTSTANGGGMEVFAGITDLVLTGQQLFTGTTAVPVLSTFSGLSLTNAGGGPSTAGPTYTLDATTAGTPTPEPSSLALLGSVLLVGGVLGRMRRRTKAGITNGTHFESNDIEPESHQGV